MKKLDIRPEMSIEKVGAGLAGYIEEHWQNVWTENLEELERLYPEYEDATYGIYLDKLLPPAWKELEKEGFSSATETQEDDFVIAGCLHFRNSLEKAKWGTPDHEKRVFWIVVQNQNKQSIGTLLFELSHSHVHFHLPSAPRLLTCPSIEREEIIKKIYRLQEEV
ncbi:DUF6022 family protein [Caldalkalibacillus mannanilyticus]|uniref:DUF6022 family protein n=1 Tax=Caldalkalibacillus mannanilyticus TaxID=1418 RepID=UPI000468640F|nr:DUF6022 family protein [Caldalkalibacillus mannanilyticus]